MKTRKYLSIDTEATGLHETTLLLQFAVVPVDASARKIEETLALEMLVHCPSFEELKPTLNEWVLEHNEGLIRKAHAEGIPPETVGDVLHGYLNSSNLVEFFEGERPVLLGKSLSALDIPLLRRYVGWERYNELFHHHTLDVTCVARGLVDGGKLPYGCDSTSKLIKHFGIREDARHTALSDAVDMATVYFRMLDFLRPVSNP